MPTVIDVITELQYNANTDVLQIINKEFGTQIQQIKQIEAENAKLQAQVDKLASTEINARKALNTLIDANKKKIDELNFGIGKQIGLNQNLSKTIVDATGKLKNLSFAGSQLLREAPAFTYSIQTGILALSNNIPILIDQLTQARAAGSTTTQIFKALGQSVFSLSGFITIGVSLLTIFGDKLFKTSEAAKAAKTDYDKFIQSLASNSEQALKSTDEQVTKIDILQGVIAKGGQSAKSAIKQLRDQFPDLTRGISDATFAQGKANKVFDEIRTQIAAKERSNALTKDASALIEQERIARIGINEIQKRVNSSLAEENKYQLEIEAAKKRQRPGDERIGISAISSLNRQRETTKKLKEQLDAANDALVNLGKTRDKLKQTAIEQGIDAAGLLFSGEKDKKQKGKTLQEIKDRIDELARAANRIDASEFDKFAKDMERSAKDINDALQPIIDRLVKINGYIGLGVQKGSSISSNQANALNTQLEVQQDNNKLIGKSKQLQQANTQAQLEADRERARNRMKIAREEYRQLKKINPESYDTTQALAKYRESRQQFKEIDYDARAEQRATISAAVEGYQFLASEAANVFDQIYQRQLDTLDRQIAMTQQRISTAVELAKLGNTEVLQAEENRLDELQKKREEVAEKQLKTDALLRASAAAIAAAQAIQTVTNAGATGDPYTAAARIAAAVAALAAGISFVNSLSQAFATGVVDYQGKGTETSDSNVVRISKGESVITAKATKEFKPFLEAMNKGTFNPYTAMAYRPEGSKQDMRLLENKLDDLITAYYSTGTTVHANISEEGVHLMTQKAKRRDANRFRG